MLHVEDPQAVTGAETEGLRPRRFSLGEALAQHGTSRVGQPACPTKDGEGRGCGYAGPRQKRCRMPPIPPAGFLIRKSGKAVTFPSTFGTNRGCSPQTGRNRPSGGELGGKMPPSVAPAAVGVVSSALWPPRRCWPAFSGCRPRSPDDRSGRRHGRRRPRPRHRPHGRPGRLAGRRGRGVFSLGNARFLGSTGGMRLNQPIVGLAATPTGAGYWLDRRRRRGLQFRRRPLLRLHRGRSSSTGRSWRWPPPRPGPATGSRPATAGSSPSATPRFFGSTGAVKLNQPIVAMVPTPSGRGYWLAASDGGVFGFGDAVFTGSAGGQALAAPVVGDGRHAWPVPATG